MLGNILARNMHQKTLIKMELQEMKMSNQWNVKEMKTDYSDSSGPNTNKQWHKVIEMDHPSAIKCTKFVMLKMTSDSGMKCMNETSLAPTLCTQLFL